MALEIRLLFDCSDCCMIIVSFISVYYNSTARLLYLSTLFDNLVVLQTIALPIRF